MIYTHVLNKEECEVPWTPFDIVGLCDRAVDI
jgi:hypothetical protein